MDNKYFIFKHENKWLVYEKGNDKIGEFKTYNEAFYFTLQKEGEMELAERLKTKYMS